METQQLDKVSLQRIQLLHPKLREEATKILADITKALTGRAMCRYTFTLRTFKEQQHLYNQGRTTKGNIVTNAKPGQSYHNWGLAVDIAMVIDGTTASWDDTKDWDNDGTSDWMECVKIFKSYGWVWGGDFHSIVDKPHFEKRFGYTWQQLLQLKSEGKMDADGYVII